MPVPRERNDANYFRPLRALLVPSHTHIILGLIQLTDGFEGAVDRCAQPPPFYSLRHFHRMWIRASRSKTIEDYCAA